MLPLPKVIQTIRSSTALAAQDVNFHRTISSATSTSLDETSQNLLLLAKRLVKASGEDPSVLQFGKEHVEGSAWRPVASLLDALFEKIDIETDRLSKPKHIYLEEGVEDIPKDAVERPQDKYGWQIDNSLSEPFKPLLRTKPHALTELHLDLVEPEEQVDELSGERYRDPAYYPHPYLSEIMCQPFPESVLEWHEPIAPKKWHSTPYLWVDTKELLHKMMDELRGATEIAVDLEHHDLRSYHGIVCLMQISDRNHDYVVDTIALRNELQPLNEIFADPAVIKVLHGAFMDVVWMQRDLGLYVVSLFDTYHAARALGLPKLSLAHLLTTYTDFRTSKKYQLADWRIRPLPPAMAAYARSDTHFLLYIYDQLRNALVEKNKVREVLAASRGVAAKRFEYSTFRPRNPVNVHCVPAARAQTLAEQYNVLPEGVAVLEAVLEWRENVARQTDESPRYVMSNRALISICTGTKVRDASLSDVARSRIEELEKIVKGVNVKRVETVEAGPVHVDYEEIAKAFPGIKERASALFSSDLLVNESSLFKGDEKDEMESRRREVRELLIESEKKEKLEVKEEIKEDEDITVDDNNDNINEDNEDSKNEVISLRKVTRAPRRNVPGEESEVVDYSDKGVLASRPREKKRFNPYGKRPEGPQPARKARRVTGGRSGTFKK